MTLSEISRSRDKQILAEHPMLIMMDLSAIRKSYLTECSEFGIMISRSDIAMYKRLKRKWLKRLNGILGKKTIA